MKVIYQPRQVRRAARFLRKRNQKFESWTVERVEQSIMATLRDHVRKVKKCVKAGDDWHFTCTGGYWILAWLADEKTIQVEVLVDASVGRERDYKRLEK